VILNPRKMEETLHPQRHTTVWTAIDMDTPLEPVQEVLLSLLVKTYFVRLYLKTPH
jgi:hypothetical protein